MPSMRFLASSALLATLAAASPTQTATPTAIAVSEPVITPAINDLKRRQVLSSLTAAVGSVGGEVDSAVSGAFQSALSAVGSGLPSYVASGILPLENLPTGTAVQKSLSLSDSDVAALPTEVLNLGPYANWTTQGWNVRFHGNVYKTPNLNESTLNDLSNKFLIGTSIQSLSAPQQSQCRNLTSEIFVIQQANVQPVFTLSPTPTAGGAQVSQVVYFPTNTTVEGDYDQFLPIESVGLAAGNATDQIQQVPIYTNGSLMGNASAYLVPPTGVTFISDIDDILRVTKIYEPAQGILNTFANTFTPWMNMPSIYANWSQALTHPQAHFHYLTTTPEQITRNYEAFISANYPPGSFDTRPLNFSDIDATISIREFLLTKIFLTFPQRKFVLIADTSNSDVMRDYPKLAHTYPSQVACILLRNTSATDPGDRFPYNTAGFAGLPQSQFMFFLTPDDLTGLDISNGHCYNSSVQQNVTFGYQGLPLDLSGNGNINYTASSASASSAAAASASKSTGGVLASASSAAASATAKSEAGRARAVGGLALGAVVAVGMGLFVL